MNTIILTYNLSVNGTIRRILKSADATSRDKVLNTYDEFSFGPLSKTKSTEEFFTLRQEFWQKHPIPYCLPHQFETHCENISKIRKCDGVEFWTTPQVQSQFFVITMLHLLELEGIDLSICRARSFPIECGKLGLGGYNEAALKELWNAIPAEEIDVKLYRKAWCVVTEGNSEIIAEFISELPQDHPLLSALKAYLMRFPEHCGGLGSIERALLASCREEWRKSAYTVGPAMAVGKPDLDSIGDHILFQHLKELAANQGWVQFRGDTTEMRGCDVKLTPSGSAIIEQFGITQLS